MCLHACAFGLAQARPGGSACLQRTFAAACTHNFAFILSINTSWVFPLISNAPGFIYMHLHGNGHFGSRRLILRGNSSTNKAIIRLKLTKTLGRNDLQTRRIVWMTGFKPFLSLSWLY